MKRTIFLSSILVLSSLLPIAFSLVHYNANTYPFTFDWTPNPSASMGFSTDMTFNTAYRENNYWYFNTTTISLIGFQVQVGTMLITDFFSTSSNHLVFQITASSGLNSTTKIWTGTRQSPQTISGATTWSYNATSKIITITKLHSSPAIITIDWWTYAPPAIEPQTKRETLEYIPNVPYTIIDDAQTGFWNLLLWQVGEIGNGTLTNDVQTKLTGSDSLKVSIGEGSSRYWVLYHTYASAQNWSSYNMILFDWYGTNTGKQIAIKIFYDFTYGATGNRSRIIRYLDDFVGWKTLVMYLDATENIGEKDLTQVTRLEVGLWDGYWVADTQASFHIDKLWLDSNNEKHLVEDGEREQFWTGYTWNNGTVDKAWKFGDTLSKASGLESEYMSVGIGTKKYWVFQHTFSPYANWTGKNLLFVYWYGTNTTDQIMAKIFYSGSITNRTRLNQYYNNFTGWKLLPIHINKGVSFGTVDMGHVSRIEVGIWNPAANYWKENYTGIFHIDAIWLDTYYWGDSPPASGTWTINSNTRVQYINIKVNGSIQTVNPALLEIHNATLTFLPSTHYIFSTANETTLLFRRSIMTNGSSYAPSAQFHGITRLDKSIFSGVGWNQTDEYGVQFSSPTLETMNVEISNTTFTYGWIGLYLKDAINITIYQSTFNNNTTYGLEIRPGRQILVQNSISYFNGDNQFQIVESSSINLTRNLAFGVDTKYAFQFSESHDSIVQESLAYDNYIGFNIQGNSHDIVWKNVTSHDNDWDGFTIASGTPHHNYIINAISFNNGIGYGFGDRNNNNYLINSTAYNILTHDSAAIGIYETASNLNIENFNAYNNVYGIYFVDIHGVSGVQSPNINVVNSTFSSITLDIRADANDQTTLNLTDTTLSKISFQAVGSITLNYNLTKVITPSWVQLKMTKLIATLSVKAEGDGYMILNQTATDSLTATFKVHGVEISKVNANYTRSGDTYTLNFSTPLVLNIQWQFKYEPYLPIMFILGMVGLFGMFTGPAYAVYLTKKRNYYEAVRSGVIFTAIGIALFIAWLWAA